MPRADTPRQPAPPPRAEADDAADDDEDVGQASARVPEELDEEEGAEELAEESGLDLTDASDLDADNVPADEEFDRVMQAPD